MGDKIHRLFANTSQLAAQNAEALTVLRKVYRARRKTLESERRRRSP
jgi:hypothetical protein